MTSYSPITLGENLKCLEVGGFIYTETKHKPFQTLAKHSHEHANIAVVLNGAFTEILGGQGYECDLRSVVVKPAGESHANRYHGDGMHCFLIEITPQRLESLHPFSKLFAQFSHNREAALSTLASRIHKELLVMDDASRLAIEGLSLELIAALSRHSDYKAEGRQPRWLKSAVEFLHAYHGERISLIDVADQVGVHPVHLAHEFRRFHNCTLGEYLRTVRIEFACQQLINSQSRLVDISMAAGFADQTHFSKVFKRYIGLSPSEFRRLFRTRS